MILYYNSNVGSGLEYVGDIIKGWIDELQVPYVEVKQQDHPLHLIKNHFLKIKPDVIIINEEHDSICTAVSYYKEFYPNTKIIYIHHVWQNIALYYTSFKTYQDKYKKHMLDIADDVICVNWPPENHKLLEPIKHKMYKGFMPMDPKIYYPSVSWSERSKMFIYLGSIVNGKLSSKFLKSIQDTDIQIDCYGKFFHKYDEYNNLFNSCKNMIYHGHIPQSEVANTLNQYKFFVMPHVGSEPFNISLLQAIMCGTIPLISNDRSNPSFTWINWAQDLYFGCNTEDELIDNLLGIVKESDISNGSEISKNTSRKAQERFDYNKMKKDVQHLILYNLNE